MRSHISNVVSNIGVTMSNQETICESRIEKMRKFLSSPLTRKKPSGSQTKTFGTSLDVLIQRTPSESSVPFIVTRICQYIEDTGLMHEGLFRISGNARLIERLKTCFDQSGDAPLETEGDVASAAALLKLFLRELPDPIIPLGMHQQFLNAVKGNDKEESVSQLMVLVQKLPFANFSLLKYLSYFLMHVSQFEEHNRMCASSLGIVFGPNLFRVSEDFGGLKEQSLTNQIVTYFITDYFMIFHDEPDRLCKLNNLTMSLDGEIKQNTSPLTANHSMVSSWPKLSSYTSIMSSLSLRPLSVSIPTMEDYPVAESINNDEHILMVNSSNNEDQQVPLREQGSDQSEKEETNGVTSSMRRKRKERKLVKEDVLASYSTLENMLHLNSKASAEDLDVFMEEKSLLHNVLEPQYNVKSVNSHGLVEVHRLQNQSNTNESAKVRKKEVEKALDPLELLLDSKNDVTISYADSDSSVSSHNSPDGQNEKNEVCSQQNSSNHSLVHASAGQSRDSPQPTTAPSMAFYNVVDSTELPQEASKRHLSTRNNNHLDVSKDSDSLKENNEGMTIQAEVHESSASGLRYERPLVEKRFCQDSKHHRVRRGHRYYKKHSAGDSHRSSKHFPKLQHDQKESQHSAANAECPREHENYRSKETAPPSDLNVSGIEMNKNNGSNTDELCSWSLLQRFHDDDTTAISPVHEFLRVSSSSEAPLSPSAYRSYLSHRSPHLDPNLPPSPPVEQEDIAAVIVDEANKATIRQLSKKIQSLKKKIKQFEENFEAAHSFRPSYAEKSYYPEVKKLITELNQARQELKELKEESPVTTPSDIVAKQRWTRLEDKFPRVDGRGSKRKNNCRFGLCLGPVLTVSESITIEESLNEALLYLEEKRKSSLRPESLEEMSREQLVEEKFTIQKLLLQFEGIHGRPCTKTHRDLMRPLYDRYRTLKRILGRSSSFTSASKLKDSVELQPILEGETMDFGLPGSRKAPLNAEVKENGSFIEKNERETDKDINDESNLQSLNFHQNENQMKPKESIAPVTKSYTSLPIHELSLSELFEQQQEARAEKRKIRKVLKEFETQFQKENGRKVQREDKREMEAVYGEYKHIRARLKLLEALVAKHGQKTNT